MERIIYTIQQNIKNYKFEDKKLYTVSEKDINKQINNYIFFMNNIENIKKIINLVSRHFIELIKNNIKEKQKNTELIYYFGTRNSLENNNHKPSIKKKICRDLIEITPNKSMIKIQDMWANTKYSGFETY